MEGYTNDDYETPEEFMGRLVQRFGRFDLDVCATERSAKADAFYDLALDGLRQTWCEDGTRAFMNPPYSALGRWVSKAVSEAEKGLEVVALILSSTDTAYWHNLIMPKAADILFVRGRIDFELGGIPQSNNRYLNTVVRWRAQLKRLDDAPYYGSFDARD